MNKKTSRSHPPEVLERTERLAQKHLGKYPTLSGAVESIASTFGNVLTTLLHRVKRNEVGNGQREYSAMQ